MARPLSVQALSNLLDRKPHLLRPLAVQLLPPPVKPIDPAKRLGIDLSSLRTAEDLQQLLPKVLAAIAHGEITPAEGARLARRARTRWRAIRRLARFERRLARRAAPIPNTPWKDGASDLQCGSDIGIGVAGRSTLSRGPAVDDLRSAVRAASAPTPVDARISRTSLS